MASDLPYRMERLCDAQFVRLQVQELTADNTWIRDPSRWIPMR
jgi:hypothetical protein